MLENAITDLDSLLTVDFHKNLLKASLKNLEDTSNPLAFNIFCSAFRELVRHVLSERSPDAEIKACDWYTPDKTSKSGITRAHAITYLIQGGLPDKYLSDVLDIDVSEEKKSLIKAVNLLNKYTHVNENTFNTNTTQALENAELAINSLTNVLKLANQCHSALVSALEEKIHDEVVSTAISESIDSIDELSTHSSVEDIEVEEVSVTNVDSIYIYLQASGTVGVTLQWGSNSDVSKGDGGVGNDAFPFTCELQIPVASPDEISVVGNTLSVDTSSWWEGYYDDEQASPMERSEMPDS